MKTDDQIPAAGIRSSRGSLSTPGAPDSLTDPFSTAVFFLDSSGRCLKCNQAFSELLGISFSEIIGKKISGFWPGTADISKPDWLEETGNFEFTSGEYDFPLPDGTTRSIILTIDIIYGESMEPAGFIGLLTGKIEQKAGEYPLQDHEARFQHIFQSAEVAVWEEDFSAVRNDLETLKAGGIGNFRQYFDKHPEFITQAAEKIIVRDVSGSSVRLAGAGSKEEILGPLSQLIEPGMIRILKEELAAIANGQTYFDSEVDIHDLQGVPRTIRVSISFPSNHDQFDRVLVNTIDITEQKRAQQALMESEQRFRDLAELLPEAVFETDADLGLVYANRAAIELFGYAPEILDQKVSGLSFLAPDDRPRAQALLQERIAGIDPGIVEYSALREDGTTFPVLFHGAAISRAGQFAGMRGIIVDISRQKQAEISLRSSEEKYRTLVEQSLQGVIIARANPVRLIFASQPMQAITGYSPKELMNFAPEQLLGLIHPDDRETFFHNFHRRLAGDPVPHRNEYRIVHIDGGFRWVEIFSTLIEYEEEPATQTVFVDITERKRAEAQLRETNETLQALIQSSPAAIVTLDLNGKVTLWNPAAEKMFGWKENEVLGKPIPIIDPEDQTFFRSRLAREKKHESRVELKRRHQNGSVLDVWLSTAPLFDGSGHVIGVIGMYEDISEQKRSQAEKTRIEEQYRQAQRVEAVGRLAGGVAHDLNNLLTPILLYSEMLLEDSRLLDEQTHQIEEILLAGNRSRDLVQQLLAFSRKQNLEYRPVDLNTVIEQFKQLIRRTIREDIRIEFNLNPLQHTVFADSGQIQQVIMNLAVNAQDAMPRGGDLILETGFELLNEYEAGKHTDLDPGEYITLTMSDTGTGMDEQTRLHIFEPFYSTKGKDGTGLGLSTVYGIVRQHSGDIQVISQPGSGSLFKIFLPAIRGVPPEEAQEAPESRLRTGSETILIVEDNPQVRNLTCSILKKLGYEVLEAENGAEGLKLLETCPETIHLLLTDVVMPELNGRELFQQAVGSRPGLKVLYMSGYTNDVIAYSGVLEAGVSYIQKPFSIPNLSVKIRECLDSV